MSPNIEGLILAICTVCLRITAAGNYHAHFTHVAHCQWIDTRVYPSNREYKGPGSAPALQERQTTYEPSFAWPGEDTLTPVMEELREHLRELEAFLPAQEPAA